MPKSADIGSKRLISLEPDAGMPWVTQNPEVLARDILTSEFQWLSRESDMPIEANSSQRATIVLVREN